MSKAYGEKVGEYFSSQQRSLVVRSSALPNHVAATYLCSSVGTGLTDPIPAEPALLVAVQLKPLVRHKLWIDGRIQRSPAYKAGAVTMLDLQSRPTADLQSNYECVQMHMPREALNQIAEAEGLPLVRDIPTMLGSDDPVLSSFGKSAMFAVSPTGPASPLLLETMIVGVLRHISKQYLGTNLTRSLRKPSLTAGQQRKVKEYLHACMDSEINLMDLARLCELSPSYFTKAFRNSMGLIPSQWLQVQRLSRARRMMVFTDLPLTEIAMACGFYDQSHFSRTFRVTEGCSPTAWRRTNKAD